MKPLMEHVLERELGAMVFGAVCLAALQANRLVRGLGQAGLAVYRPRDRWILERLSYLPELELTVPLARAVPPAFPPPSSRRIPILELAGGRTFALELEQPLRGPRAVCELCGAVYSTAAWAERHPCHAVPRADASPWEPYERPATLSRSLRDELEGGRGRSARGRPLRPHRYLTEPVRTRGLLGPEQNAPAAARRRCYLCRRPLGKLTEPVEISAMVRGQAVHFARHPWCRSRAS